MNRKLRVLTVAVAVGMLLMTAGCAGDGEQDQAPSTEGEIPAEGTPEEAPTQEGSDTGAEATPENPDYEVRVSYEGEWELTTRLVKGSGETESRVINGTGTRTVDVEDQFSELTAKAFQDDTGITEITIELLADGETLSSKSMKGPGATVEVTERP